MLSFLKLYTNIKNIRMQASYVPPEKFVCISNFKDDNGNGGNKNVQTKQTGIPIMMKNLRHAKKKKIT